MNQRTLSNLRKAVAIGGVAFLTAALAADVFARVGGGQSYGGGGGHGGGGGGAATVWLGFQAVRLLLHLTIEYPTIGIPLDNTIACAVIVFSVRRVRASTARNDLFSSAAFSSI